MDRVLRVDLVGRTSSQDRGDSVDGDPKSSVFVGNLDFGSKEEDLRVFFEKLGTGERGPPADNDEQDGDVKKSPMWVTRVRIVRDKESQLGKGFAYVQFADRQCVDEVLALEEAKLKFAKRTSLFSKHRDITFYFGCYSKNLRPTDCIANQTAS
ncbi:uncharacterized protein ARMOST_16072 [Armillaria ostoyae]|uniref:Nucleolar protein 12 n=1 Tax=Armillaria ostoyae TaxID=47428 RepID=A0A284RV56_ARMOS|nr:uncharacterized protein ARMOST_16072 [Armillaria ostoyae]